MARPNTLNGGRKPADRTAFCDWFLSRLSTGPVESEVLFDEVEQKNREGVLGFSRTAVEVVCKSLKNRVRRLRQADVWWFVDLTIGIPIPATGVNSPRAIAAQEVSKLIRNEREEREYREDVQHHRIATEAEIIERAQLDRSLDRIGLDNLLQFAKDHPAREPLSEQRIIDLYVQYGPQPKSEQQLKEETEKESARLAEEAEIERLASLPEGEFQLWIKGYRASRRRPPTAQELAKRREDELDSFNNWLSGKRGAIAMLESQTLSKEEFEALPEVEVFIKQHPDVQEKAEEQKNKKTKSPEVQTLLDLIRKHAGRKLTPEEIQKKTAAIEEEIASRQAMFEAEQNKAPATISTMTQTERDFIAKVQTKRMK
jgi:hypothetical protein